MDAVTADLNRYLIRLDHADAADCAIENKVQSDIEEGGEYYHLLTDNFIEGLGEIRDDEIELITLMLKAGQYEKAAITIENSIKAYWVNIATQKAEEYASKYNCCLGIGCPICEPEIPDNYWN